MSEAISRFNEAIERIHVELQHIVASRTRSDLMRQRYLSASILNVPSINLDVGNLPDRCIVSETTHILDDSPPLRIVFAGEE